MGVLFDLQQQTLLISFGFGFFRFSREITLRYMQALNLCTLGLRKDTFESSLGEIEPKYLFEDLHSSLSLLCCGFIALKGTQMVWSWSPSFS